MALKRSKIIVVHTGCNHIPFEAGFCTLSHPKTGTPTTFVVLADLLLELSVFKKKHNAWLNGSAVIADGGLHMATPLDPLFLVLSSAASKVEQREEARFVDAEELLRDDSCPALVDLLPMLAAQLPCLCDVKESGGDRYYRFSRARSRAWLLCKVAATRAALAAMTPCPLPPSEAAAQTYAAGLVCEYLNDDWAAVVQGFTSGSDSQEASALAPGKRSNDDDQNVSASGGQVVKKTKTVAQDPKQKAAASREANRVAAFAKVAKGSLSIGSFFQKKGS